MTTIDSSAAVLMDETTILPMDSSPKKGEVEEMVVSKELIEAEIEEDASNQSPGQQQQQQQTSSTEVMCS